MDNKFTCSICGETYDKLWSDDEANKEAEELWGVENASINDDMAVICDDCWNNRTPIERGLIGEDYKNNGA